MRPERPRFIILGLCAVVAIFLIRLFYLQVFRHQDLLRKAEMQLQKTIVTASHRGIISDRAGHPFAVSYPAMSVYVIPNEVSDKYQWAQHVSQILGIDFRTTLRMVNRQSSFVWVKRKIPKDKYAQLKALNLAGTNFVREDDRLYPLHHLAAQIVGYVGIDNQGLAGVEYYYDTTLKGKPGKIILEGDPQGFRIVSGKRDIKDASTNGSNITLTIDEYLQFLTQAALVKGVESSGAEGGQAIVMNPKTGEILAMASYPEFDANSWQKYPANVYHNKAISDCYEPGSVFKIITISAVLEEKLVRPDTVIMVPPTLTVGDRQIREAHGRPAGETDAQTVTDILRKSLNVGTSLLAQRLGKDTFYRYIRLFGFGEPTRIGLPGETPGILRNVKNWSAVDLATFSYGQGIGASLLQMASAVSVIANEGIMQPPVIIKSITDAKNLTLRTPKRLDPVRIISAKTANEVTTMMTGVIDEGTGSRARIPGFSVAGKTGTAQKAGAGGYLQGQYLASLVGFLPAKNPHVVILVAIDSPKSAIWGNEIAGPIFKEIALGAIHYFNIAPDRIAKPVQEIHFDDTSPFQPTH